MFREVLFYYKQINKFLALEMRIFLVGITTHSI